MASGTFYDIGDYPVVTGAFTNARGTPTAPTAVTVLVRDPSGNETSYTSAANPSAFSLGTSTTFTFPTALDEAGEWAVSMKGTATVLCRSEITFTVRASLFASP